MKASTCDLTALGERLKAARDSLKLTRPAFVEKFGGSVRTLENNEAGRNEPGAGLIATYAANGINANWLLTGDGPMLIDDLVAQPSEATAAAARERLSDQLYSRLIATPAMCIQDTAVAPTAAAFNLKAYQAILVGLLNAGAPPDQAVGAAMEFYEINVRRGLITADGSPVQAKGAA